MITKKITVATAALLVAGSAFASPAYLRGGPSLTTGAASNPNSLLSGTYNPAATSLVVNEKAPFRMGVLPSIGFGAEFGQVDNFIDQIEDLEEELDKDNITQEDAEKAIDSWDSIREELGEEGYVKFYVGAQAPLMPVSWYFDDIGTFTLDLSVAAEVRAIVLDDQLSYNNVEDELETNTSLYVKSGVMTNIGLGFSRELNLFADEIPGELHWGVRLNVVAGQLSKQVARVDNDDEDEDIGDVVTDEYDSNSADTTSFGLDAGLLWELPRSRVGVFAKNIIEPKLDYGAIGKGCGQKQGAARDNCLTAQYFSNEIKLEESHVQNTQVTVEGSVYLGKDANLSLSGAYDMNSVASPVGDEFQMMSVSLAYFPHRFYIPGVRIGYHQNQAGSELSSAALGLSFFRRVNLDFLVGLDTIEQDGDEVPRTFAVNLGIEMAL